MSKQASVFEKIPVGISSCLLGEKVRYDGAHKHNSYIDKTLGQYFVFQPFCPEVDIGLGVPRKTIRLAEINQSIECVASDNEQQTYTQQLRTSADLQKPEQTELCGYIWKKGSPSCGMERVKVFKNGIPQNTGVGIFARQFMANYPLVPTEEEGRLGDPVLRENFVQRVFIYHRWKTLQQTGLTAQRLIHFHAQHKLIIMSRHQNAVRELGQLIAQVGAKDVTQTAKNYIEKLMPILKKPATRKNHVNVLQHIQGYLKRDLDAGDRAELSESIAQYYRGEIPLIVPITLLKHFFRKHPDSYIEQSFYMHAYPEKLALANRL